MRRVGLVGFDLGQGSKKSNQDKKSLFATMLHLGNSGYMRHRRKKKHPKITHFNPKFPQFRNTLILSTFHTTPW